ncbi:universal stress protein Sll1388 [Ciona intestinalis]
MKVFIAVDNSDLAEKAFDWYFRELHKDGNDVLVAHSAEYPHIGSYAFLGGQLPVEEIHAASAEATKKYEALKEKYLKKIEDQQSAKIFFEVHEKPAEGLVKMAEKSHCDFIVIGSRGLGAVRRTILGSISDYVMHHAKVPVMVFHK